MNTDEAATPTGTKTSAGAPWLSVADAAAALGISPRAVQKRAAKGQITARKTDGAAAARWEIDGRELGANRDANREPPGREPGELSGALEREAGREPRTLGREQGANSGELWREREAELKSEIAFLRGIVEADRRDMAEVRAALRAALKLTAGAALPELTAGQSSTTAPTLTSRQQHDENDVASNQGTPEPTTQPRRPDRRGGGLRLVRDGLKAMFGQ